VVKGKTFLLLVLSFYVIPSRHLLTSILLFDWLHYVRRIITGYTETFCPNVASDANGKITAIAERIPLRTIEEIGLNWTEMQ